MDVHAWRSWWQPKPQSSVHSTTSYRGKLAKRVKPQQSRSADGRAELLAYLIAVYPGERAALQALRTHELSQRFESLDYYYACHATRTAAMLPEGGCSPITSSDGTKQQPPRLPYLPPGTYYRAQPPSDPSKQRWNTNGALLEHPKPVQRVIVNLDGAARGFHSALAGRAGPQPAWTNPFAITRSTDRNSKAIWKAITRNTSNKWEIQ